MAETAASNGAPASLCDLFDELVTQVAPYLQYAHAQSTRGRCYTYRGQHAGMTIDVTALYAPKAPETPDEYDLEQQQPSWYVYMVTPTGDRISLCPLPTKPMPNFEAVAKRLFDFGCSFVDDDADAEGEEGEEEDYEEDAAMNTSDM